MTEIQELEQQLKQAKEALKKQGEVFIESKKHKLIGLLQEYTSKRMLNASIELDGNIIKFHCRHYTGNQNWRESQQAEPG